MRLRRNRLRSQSIRGQPKAAYVNGCKEPMGLSGYSKTSVGDQEETAEAFGGLRNSRHLHPVGESSVSARYVSVALQDSDSGVNRMSTVIPLSRVSPTVGCGADSRPPVVGRPMGVVAHRPHTIFGFPRGQRTSGAA